MSVTAHLRYLRIAPRKIRLVADLIRGKSVEEAQRILSFLIKKGAQPILKLLKSAEDSAKKNFRLNESNLYISKIFIDEGPKYKRWRARARGMAAEIQKKTSHITLVLDETPKESRRLPTGQVVKKAKKAGEVKEIKKVEEEEKVPKMERPKIRPEIEVPKPKIEKGLRRIFRRKSF